MKSILRTFLFVNLLVFSYAQASAWGQKGHDVTAYIAEKHLTPAAKAAVDSIFDGMSIVYWSNWLDNASHTIPYDYTSTWHYINVDAGKTYETMPREKRGDVVTAVRGCIAQLADPESSKDARQLALKILVHCMGDMHQPMHTGHKSDLGGNRTKVKYFGRDTNLHSVWDGSLVESAHKWSYSEWQDQIDRASEAEQQVIVSGNIVDWVKQSLAIAQDIYAETPDGSSLSYNDVAHWAPVIESQFLKGGLRLAHVLNLLFDPEYTHSEIYTSAPAL